MQTLSFILNGNSVTSSELEKIHNKLEQLDDPFKNRVEFLIYFSKQPNFASSNKSVLLVNPVSKNVSALQKAIASASGEALIFTTVKNVLADENNIMLNQAFTILISSIAVPTYTSDNFVSRSIGLRNFSKTPYILAEKHYATSNSNKFNSFSNLIRYTDKLLSLKRVPLQPEAQFPDYLIRNLTLIRPYGVIAKHKWRSLKQKIYDWRKARIAEKLRLQVKPVYYSDDIPVFIICRDRVKPLKQLVSWCEDEGLKNIIFIDNASTYPPLLKYLRSSPYEVVWLNSNIGHTAPWDAGVVNVYAKNKPFIVTDPDIIPSIKSHGAIKLFCRLLTEHPERTKVGFGLKIDDLPDSYELKEYVIAWEKQFWVSVVENDVFDAEIDTTFALYRQNTPYTLGPGLRTGGRFVAKHEPWYMDSRNVSAELQYYRDHANKIVGSWGTTAGDMSDTYLVHKNKVAQSSPS